MARPDRPGFALHILDLDAAARPLEPATVGRVAREATKETDVLWVEVGAAVEELRVLRTPAAPARIRYRIELGSAVAELRVRDGRIEAVDDKGWVGLGTGVLFALDGNDRDVPVHATVEGTGRTRLLTLNVDLTHAVFPVVVDPLWSVVAPMKYARRNHSQVTLDTGKVLVVGGAGAPNGELYDPTTNTWATLGATSGLGSAAFARNWAFPVTGGKAVVIHPNNLGLAFDGVSFATFTGPSVLRQYPAATQLADGRVFLVGGTSTSASTPALSSAEILDPVTSTWTATAPMGTPRADAIALRLPSGKVLVAGGTNDTDLLTTTYTSFSSAEIYDPATNTWAVAPPMSAMRGHPLGVVVGGKALVGHGAYAGSPTIGEYDNSSAELFDPVAGTWTSAGNWARIRGTFRLAPLLVLDTNTVFLANPPYETWTAGAFGFGGEPAIGRRDPSASPLPGGRVMVTGGGGAGGGSSSVSTAEIYQLQALGSACEGGFECASGACTEGVCCNKADCGKGASCVVAGSVGSCKKLGGVACATDGDCGSAHCVDGVCCNRACTAQCEACDEPGLVGTCSTIKGAPHGARTGCADGKGDPCLAQSCDGLDATKCSLPKAGAVACGKAACTAGIETHGSTCDGAGKCQDVVKACGVYACGATTCLTTCATSADCAKGFWCSGTTCVAKLDLGKTCSSGSACRDGLFCTDGACCGVETCGPGATCAIGGRCQKANGTACVTDVECSSAHCVDGVCCDGACGGQCEVCNVPGQLGRCLAVQGAPHGARPPCATDEASPCKSAACDGAITTTCAGLVGPERKCGTASCKGGVLTPATHCDGKGACLAPSEVSCDGFACEGAIGCKKACASDGDCLDGWACRAGACAKITDTCSADRTQAIPLGGSPLPCAPYVCQAGACLGACGSSADCQLGWVCAFATKTCELPTSPAAVDEGGGCTVGHGPRGSMGVVFLSVLGIALARRRRVAAALGFGVAVMGCRSAETEAVERRVPTRPAEVVPTVTATRPFTATGDRWIHHAEALDVELPPLSEGALRLRMGGVEVAVAPLVESRAARVEGHALVFRAVRPGEDLVYVGSSLGVEEFRRLEGPAASHAFAWRLTLPAQHTARARDGRFEVVDPKGWVVASTLPVVALDARGVRRPLSLVVESFGSATIAKARLDGAGLRYPVWVDPLWTAGSASKDGHMDGAMVTLADGRILVTGGYSGPLNTYVSSAEIYDPGANTWSTVADLAEPRHGHGLARTGAKVLLVGGSAVVGGVEVDPPKRAVLYDVATNTWSNAASCPFESVAGAVVGLSDGRVLVAGGAYTIAGGPVANTATWDPTTDTWTARTPLSVARGDFAIVTVGDRVVLAGGGNGSSGSFAGVDVFDRLTNTWTSAALGTARLRPFAAPLPGGKVLVGGGAASYTIAAVVHTTAEIFDPVTKTTTPTGAMKIDRQSTGAAALASGAIVVAGGLRAGLTPTSSAELYEPATGLFRTLPSMLERRSSPFLLSTSGGSAVLVLGGVGGVGAASEGVHTVARYAPMANGAVCAADFECASAHCVDFTCCGTASCPVGSSCGTPTKAGTCAKSDGATCAGASECGSGQCVDGVCCESACPSTCAACDVPGKLGKCVPVAGVPHGARTACTATVTECGLRCDGVDDKACHPTKIGVACGIDGCASGTETHVGTCDGTGACGGTSTKCAPFACGATKCLSTCATPTDCAEGFTCVTGACVALAGKGVACAGTSECAPGLYCTDGVCCATATCAAGNTCDGAASKGVCARRLGATCTSDAECGSGHCADGVCCATACGGTCQACDLPGKAGVCTAVVGKPRGVKACGDPSACGVVACDGSAVDKCTVAAGADVECRPESCAGGSATARAFCDGKGGCPAPVVSGCGGFACDGPRCRTSCRTPTECATGHACRSGGCVPLAGICQGADLVAADKTFVTCAPYACADGSCKTRCETSADCAPGAACDGDSHSCTVATAAESDGGCSTRPGRTSGGLFVLVGLLAWAQRRKRPQASRNRLPALDQVD